MDDEFDASEARFSRYVEGLVEVIGHANRVGPLRDYCLGLLMPVERKSVEPMAGVTSPSRVAAHGGYGFIGFPALASGSSAIGVQIV